MTEHAHSTYVEGCYRCALSRDEVAPPGEDEAVDAAYMAPKVQPVSALRIVARHPDGTETDVTEGVQILYDHTVESMDWGSGFLDNDEALVVVKVAQACGFLTPDSAKETFMSYLKNHAQGLRCQVCGVGVRYDYRWADDPTEQDGNRWIHTDGSTEEWRHPPTGRMAARWRELPADHAVDLWPRGEVVDAEAST